LKILLLRANEVRHQALAQRLESIGQLAVDFVEEIRPAAKNPNLTSLGHQHFDARAQAEEDFFGRFDTVSNVRKIFIPQSEINSTEFHDLIDETTFDMAITFGVSILSNSTIQKLRNRVLGIHLGLSPFYRGSGTNFFPFVNGELGAVGFTLMHLDEGVDTGRIVHQGRAPIVLGDSIHSIGNRNIEYLFRDICSLVKQNVKLESAIEVDHRLGKLYRRRDFTEESLKIAMHNLRQGLVETTLRNIESETERFPIHRSALIDVS
jgi:methionyl-tRNA formyltransferase